MFMRKDRRKRDIKSKLLAAVAMLLVSSIMVVSSTYAWFTLSTAPEVKGISTAIGANGNLEMALLPNGTSVTEALAAIGNASGNQTTVQKNVTWGNLVDLNGNSYGLDQISLFPAQLAVIDNTLSSHYLGTPIYGNDGRFIEVGTSAFAAAYGNGVFGTNSYGVRAIGTSSGMSAMELAYRDALSSANDAFNRAISETKNSATVGGSALGSIAVKRANDANAVYTQDDVANLVTAYTAMDRALQNIENALKQYIIAYALGNMAGMTEENYLITLETMQDAELSGLKTYASGAIAGYIEELVGENGMRPQVTAALAALDTLESDGTATEENDEGDSVTVNTYSWAKISSYLTALANLDTMLLNGRTISYYIENNMANVGELVENMQNLVLEVNAVGAPDTGLYARMAKFVDDFTSPVTIKNIRYGSLQLEAGITATMKVYSSVDPAYLSAAKTAAGTYPTGRFGSGGGSILSDYFGYIVDMAFRTNVAGSSLKLQTEATDRIYDSNDNTDAATMGGGSYMTFSYEAAADFTAENLENLMQHIRVVFFNPATNAVLGYARLDSTDKSTVTNEQTGGVSITMALKMWDPTANDNTGAWKSDSIITALQQNTATAVSTLVYLDGTELTNADVANVDLTGSMNLQFSSTANLVPMEYGDLLNGGTQAPQEYNVTVNGVALSQKAVAGQSYSVDIDELADILNGQTVTGVTVTMGGEAVTDAYNAETHVVTVSEVSGDLVITVALGAAAG